MSESQEMSEYSETTPLLPESKNKKQVKNAINLPTSTSQANKKPSDVFTYRVQVFFSFLFLAT